MPYRQNFPIPSVIDPPKQCLCIQIPNTSDWKAVIAGNLGELQYWFNWERTGDTSGAQCAAVWKEVMNSIDWSAMSCCCDDAVPVQYRYTGDGILQRSTDGGETWDDAPEYDPRNNSPEFPQIPGDDGDDKRCQAAVGASLLVKEQIGDNLTDDMARYTLQQLITDWVTTMIQSSNPFEALLTVVSNQIFALVIAVVRPALTEEVYDTFACQIYCTAADDASYTDSQWAELRSKILSSIGGVAGIFLEHLVYLLGARGMTNLLRNAPSADGDCSDCDCTEPCSIVVNTAPGMEVNLDVPPNDIDEDGNCVYIVESQLAFDSYQALYFGFGIGTFYDADTCGYMLYDTLVLTGGTINGTVTPIATNCGGSSNSLPHDGCYAQMGFQTAPGNHTPFTVEIHIRACP